MCYQRHKKGRAVMCLLLADHFISWSLTSEDTTTWLAWVMGRSQIKQEVEPALEFKVPHSAAYSVNPLQRFYIRNQFWAFLKCLKISFRMALKVFPVRELFRKVFQDYIPGGFIIPDFVDKHAWKRKKSFLILMQLPGDWFRSRHLNTSSESSAVFSFLHVSV